MQRTLLSLAKVLRRTKRGPDFRELPRLLSAHLARDSALAHAQRQTEVFHIGALIISRIGFWGTFYYNYNKELPK